MQSTMRLTRGLLFLALLAPCVAGCASTKLIATPPTACSQLVPDSIWAATPPAPFPQGNTSADLAKFGDGQTAALDQANRDKTTAHAVVSGCEARDAAAVRQITRPWWQVWPAR